MTYTYYWGFICVGIDKSTGKQCGAFVGATKYETHVRMGLQDISSERGIRADCDRCGLRYGYSPDEIVYSLRPDEMVPLDREQ
jgi:hypothetical protein